MYLQQVINPKIVRKTYFLLASSQPLTKKVGILTRIREPVVRIRGSGSVPNCHRPITLVTTKGETVRSEQITRIRHLL
jgi:hypothetical protein